MDLTPDERAALRLVPLAKELMDMVRERLPDGTDFGLMVLVPGSPVGRIIALTTDRDVVAPAVAHWVMDVLSPDQRG